MNMADITTFISNVGFPIACCAALFWYVYKQQDKMRESLDNNTTALTKLVERLDKKDV